jgi:hypothetical protein
MRKKGAVMLEIPQPRRYNTRRRFGGDLGR